MDGLTRTLQYSIEGLMGACRVSWELGGSHGSFVLDLGGSHGSLVGSHRYLKGLMGVSY